MSELYGNLWVKQYGTVGGHDFLTWANEINSLPTGKVMAAIEAVKDEAMEFPPNLIKFLRLCRQSVPLIHREAQLPPPPPKRSDKARADAVKVWGELFGYKSKEQS